MMETAAKWAVLIFLKLLELLAVATILYFFWNYIVVFAFQVPSATYLQVLVVWSLIFFVKMNTNKVE